MNSPTFFERLMGFLLGPDPAVPDGTPRDAPPTPPAGSASPAAFDYDDPRIPDTSRQRVAIVRTLIAEIEARAAAKGVTGPVLVDLKQMRDNHLPTLLASYIDIPAEHRAEIFRETGRSASYILNDGLDKMATRLRAMSKDLARGDIEAFSINSRFIESRYGDDTSPFD